MLNYFDEKKISKLYPGATMIPPMSIGTFPNTKGITMEDVYDNGEYFLQVKKDGACYMYNKTSNGNSYLFGRTKSRKTGLLTEKSANVPHVMEALDKIFADVKDCLIIGEIYFPGKTSKDVTKIMGCLPDKAVQRQIEDPIYYYIHDIVLYDGKDLTGIGAYSRWLLLKEKIDEYNKEHYLPYFIEVAESYVNNLEELTYKFLQTEEGVVLKRIESFYYPGKRPAWETIKVKKYLTVDVVCTGFCDPTDEYYGKEIENWEYWINVNTGERLPIGKHYDDMEGSTDFAPVTKPCYYGWKTAMKIGAYDVNGNMVDLGTVSSGINDFLKEDFSKNPEKYMYKTVEIGGMNLEKSAIRHGRFIRFRDDKAPEDCLYEEIFL